MSDRAPLPTGPLAAGRPAVAEAAAGPRRLLTVLHGSARWNLLVGGSITGAFLLIAVLPWFLPVIEGRLVTRFVAVGIALLGLQFVVGRAGQLSLCHGVFVGIGSYTTTISISSFDLPHLAGVALAPVFGFAAGCLVGLLALRIRATYLGPVTLSVAVVFPMIVKRFTWFTGGSSGLPLVREMVPPAFLDLSVTERYRWNHLVVVAIAALAVVAARNVVLSRIGIAVRAVADNPLSSATSGVNVRRTSVLAFGWGSAYGALGGALLVLDTPVVGADSYDLFRSLGYYAAVMVGGAASMIGAALGAALLIGVPWLISAADISFTPNLVLGVLLVVSTVVAPGGVAVAVRDAVLARIRVRYPLQDLPLPERRGAPPRRPTGP